MVYRVISLVMAVLLAGGLVACANAPTPPPTLSPDEAATRLAQIPTAAIAPKATAAAIAAAPTHTPETPPTAMPEPAFSPTPRTGESEYVVKDGDTLSSIADKFGISMASIQLDNDMGESQVVQLGQKLKIPAGKQFPDENVYWFVTIIQPGDTLTGLSSRYGVSVNDLMRVNKLDNAANIRIGQPLIVPVTLPSNPAASTGGPSDDSVETALAAAPAPTSVVAATNADDNAITNVAPTPEIIELDVAPDAGIITNVAPEAPAAASAAKIAPEANAAVAAVADSASNGDIEVMRATMLALYNQARAEGGEPPLAASFVLQQSAQGHAEDCAQRGFGSHVGSDGAGARERMLRAGYSGRITGENWAWARSAEEAFTMWFYRETPDGPHRKNIMSGQYREVGFGIIPSKGGYYFIANLGAP